MEEDTCLVDASILAHTHTHTATFVSICMSMSIGKIVEGKCGVRTGMKNDPCTTIWRFESEKSPATDVERRSQFTRMPMASQVRKRYGEGVWMKAQIAEMIGWASIAVVDASV